MPSSPFGASASAFSTRRGLAVADALVRLVELGVELAAVLVERRASVAEALPELLAGRLRQSRAVLLLGLPLVEQRAQVGGGLLPLHAAGIAGGEGLGLLDQLGACAHRVVDRLRGTPRPRSPTPRSAHR